MVYDGSNVTYQCHSCACGGCSVTLAYLYEGYMLYALAPSCGCEGHGEVVPDVPPAGTRVVPPYSTYEVVVTNEAAAASDRMWDVELLVSFRENDTNLELRRQTNQVAFANGVSPWGVFHPVKTNAVPAMVKKYVSQLQWNLHEIGNDSVGEFRIANSGEHTVYTVLAHPTAPWKFAREDKQCAWASALECACQWADGMTTTNSMMLAVTLNLFYNMGFRYDTEKGGSAFWNEDDQEFDLSGYLAITNANRIVYSAFFADSPYAIDEAEGATRSKTMFYVLR